MSPKGFQGCRQARPREMEEGLQERPPMEMQDTGLGLPPSGRHTTVIPEVSTLRHACEQVCHAGLTGAEHYDYDNDDDII